MASPAALPDFDAYPVHHRILEVRAAGRGVDVRWEDGLEARFHVFTLKESAPETVHPESREQAVMLTELPDDLLAVAAGLESGAIWVRWSTGEESRFHPGWLRAHAPGGPDPAALPPRRLWDAHTLPEVPRFGPEVRQDEAARRAWLTALHVHGVAIVQGLPAEESSIELVPERVGPIRTTNFGRTFVVQTRPDVVSNAYTAMALPVHTDLCTREYEPGLQFLLCVASSATGGRSILADGFQLAEVLRQESPEAFEALSRVPLVFSNKARESDFRHEAPMFGLDGSGNLLEVRWSPWLRGPLRASFEDAEAVYEGLRRVFRLAESARFRIQTRLQPGELLCFDNRRILHGRTAYDPSSGDRKLVGCYVEREELDSALRMAAREQRRAEVARRGS